MSKNIFVGVCTAAAPLANYVGSDRNGWGYLANRALWHNKVCYCSLQTFFSGTPRSVSHVLFVRPPSSLSPSSPHVFVCQLCLLCGSAQSNHRPYGKLFKEGDRIGVVLDCDSGTLSFYLWVISTAPWF